jgi:hypothetical protein
MRVFWFMVFPPTVTFTWLQLELESAHVGRA